MTIRDKVESPPATFAGLLMTDALDTAGARLHRCIMVIECRRQH
jgi:hypothetical protein